MSKEQPCLTEHRPCASSSKNAKDKSNSPALLAIRNTKDTDDSRGRGSHCSSEKDSGFSDGSDWQQTDVENRRNNKSQSRCGERAESSQPGENHELRRGNPRNPTLMARGSELTPIYIVKNMVLKQQPDMIQKRGQLTWRNGSRETGSSGAAQIILLQQPSSSSPDALHHHKPLYRKSSATGKKINGAYLPILNSYPRIAPHPSKKPPDKSLSNNESQNLSKKVCIEHKSDDTAVTRGLPAEHLHKQPKLTVVTAGLRCSSSPRDSLSSSSVTTVSSSRCTPPGSSLYATTSILAPRRLHRNGTISTRHRRFLNTVEILRQSGLLDITLRTKELLRKSNATDQSIAQLRQHTEQLRQAASNPICSVNGITAWEHLHRAMAESGSYPNLKTLQNLQTLHHSDRDGQPETIPTGEANGPLAEVIPSRLLANFLHPNQNCRVSQQSHSQQGRELKNGDKSSEKVTFMPPDSSTG